jgi:hypothetical protein
MVYKKVRSQQIDGRSEVIRVTFLGQSTGELAPRALHEILVQFLKVRLKPFPATVH